MSSHCIQPLLNKKYLKAVSASGVFIYDENGKGYLDGSSGPVASSLGHTHPGMAEHIIRQLGKIQFVYRTQFGTEEAEQLAWKLAEISPGKQYDHTFFVNSGSEATETALKIAIQYWRERGRNSKIQFISRQKSYHGITMGSLAVSGHQIRRQQFEKVLWHSPEKLTRDLETDSLEKHLVEVEAIIRKTGADHIAGLILEPIIGAAGTVLVPPDGYYQAMKQICREHEILFMADEVMTGLGRTGKYFGLDHWDTYADIVTIGKSLGAGYAPIAATMMTDAILDPIRKGSGLIMSGHTYSAHPLSCATALQVLNIIEQDNLVENVNRMGGILKMGLHAIKDKFGLVQTVRGKGLLLGMELDPAVPGLQGKIIERCFENGLLVYPSMGGKDGNAENGLLIAPPYIISESETEQLLDLLDTSISQVAQSL
ncbi:MAG: aminotransferase class III-fold pyridoxal phosphate-dependent enzyme [Saprospiraceae bacterium]|nr:aminotransferase class III-fold pyridoxal phosphate-dependent enzyme [Saprospiraceae bacterium]MCB9321021.1 aminotransferase class III-fold pyridoxal phosphate-dependent enzyme [Lewinellaceae bacterium]